MGIVYHTLRGIDTIELSTMMRGDVRFISVYAPPSYFGMKLSAITLPQKSAFIGIYRGEDDFTVHSEDPEVKERDEVLTVTRLEYVREIYEQFGCAEGN